MRFAASSNEMFHLLLFAIGSNEFVLVAHDLVSGAVTANRHSHGDCQHPACIMLLGYHWADVLPAAAPYRAPTTLAGAIPLSAPVGGWQKESGPPTSRNRSREVKFARAIDIDCALRRVPRASLIIKIRACPCRCPPLKSPRESPDPPSALGSFAALSLCAAHLL